MSCIQIFFKGKYFLIHFTVIVIFSTACVTQTPIFPGIITNIHFAWLMYYTIAINHGLPKPLPHRLSKIFFSFFSPEFLMPERKTKNIKPLKPSIAVLTIHTIFKSTIIGNCLFITESCNATHWTKYILFLSNLIILMGNGMYQNSILHVHSLMGNLIKLHALHGEGIKILS